MQKYNVDWFIQKFESIPEDRWCINEIENEKGQFCALGHFCCSKSEHYDNEALRSLIKLFQRDKPVHNINNGIVPEYQQETPKQRVLTALYDMKVEEQQSSAVKEVNEILSNPILETV